MLGSAIMCADENTTDSDFALVKLERKIQWENYPHIRPVCLPADASETYEGRSAIVTGWGTTNTGAFPPDLKEVEVGVISNEVCKIDCFKKYNNIFLRHVKRTTTINQAISVTVCSAPWFRAGGRTPATVTPAGHWW